MSSYTLISSSKYINMHMFVCNNLFELIFRDVVARFQVLSVAVGKPGAAYQACTIDFVDLKKSLWDKRYRFEKGTKFRF